MIKRKYIIFSITSLLLLMQIGASHANCINNLYGETVCGNGPCAKDLYGEVYCSAFGGDILRDQYGDLQCGVGGCAKDSYGLVWCSKVQGGGAAKNSYGEVTCFEGCQKGSIDYCFVAQ